MKITMSLNTKSINAAIKELKNYKKSLKDKCHQFVEELALKGVYVAATTAGPYGQFILFHADVEDRSNGAKAVMFGQKSGDVIRQWKLRDGSIKEAEVNPLLMAEFGSGAKASDASGKPNAKYATSVGAGRGTFPEQIHAFEDKWYWLDLNDEWHESSGEEPTMPMFNAYIEMQDKIEEVARQVFGT